MEIQGCRVCLATDKHLLSLAENNVITAFEDVVGYKINLNNSLPKHICNVCKVRIHRHDDFKKRCCYVQNQLEAKLADGLPITNDFMKEMNKTFQAQNLAFTEALKSSISNTETECHGIATDGLFLEIDESDCFDREIKDEYVSATIKDDGRTYEYEDLLENNDLNTLKVEKTQLESTNSEQIENPITRNKNGSEKIFLKRKTTKRDSKKETITRNSPLKKQKKASDEVLIKAEQKLNKLAKSNTKPTSKLRPVTRVNWNKRMTEQSLKKYNMQLKILTREEQIEKMLARKESDKYKNARLKCELCYKPYTGEKAFENHTTLHRPSPLRPVKCELCHLYLSHSTIRDHVRSHRKELVCLQCGEEVSTVQMKLHHDFHAGVKFECKECRKIYHHKSTYMSHLRARHADVVCALCGDVFFGHQGIFVHVKKSHLEDAREQCDSCKHYFISTEAVQRHLDTCCKNVSPCGWCGVSAADSKGLAQHIAATHNAPKSPKELVCTECNSSFRMEAALTSHWRRVHQEKSGRQLEAAKALKDKPKNSVVCEQCGAMVISSCHLRMHMMKHTGEKPHQCDVCHKSFRLLTTLKSHMLVHSGEKPFQCSECPNAYRQKSHLKIHLRTHTGEKPYACEMCHKAFACKGNRDEHARTVHGGLPPKRRGGGKRRGCSVGY